MNPSQVALLLLTELLELAACFVGEKNEDLLEHAAIAWDEWMRT